MEEKYYLANGVCKAPYCCYWLRESRLRDDCKKGINIIKENAPRFIVFNNKTFVARIREVLCPEDCENLDNCSNEFKMVHCCHFK